MDSTGADFDRIIKKLPELETLNNLAKFYDNKNSSYKIVTETNTIANKNILFFKIYIFFIYTNMYIYVYIYMIYI